MCDRGFARFEVKLPVFEIDEIGQAQGEHFASERRRSTASMVDERHDIRAQLGGTNGRAWNVLKSEAANLAHLLHKELRLMPPPMLTIGQIFGSWLSGIDESEKYEFAIALLRDAALPHQMRKRDRDRAEALHLAGGRPPSLRNRAVALAQERGEVRTRDLTDVGIPRCYLSRMCEEGLLVKVGYGRYRAAAYVEAN
ncbi:hypothetical protein X770_32585 [Mesorhizobium sp. LSJC269B00]|nr:hypothetical protein X770_32585 [Mesorhizobium sp. LSJC269B00]